MMFIILQSNFLSITIAFTLVALVAV